MRSLLVPVLLLGLCGCSRQAEIDLAASKQRNVELSARIENDDKEMAGLRDELRQAQASASNANCTLTQAKALIADYQKQIDKIRTAEKGMSDRQKLIDAVPAVNSGGVIVFPQLLSPSGFVLMSNAEFRKPFGRKVVFKSGTDLASFDVDQLHPGVLLRLGIDSDKAKETQARMDAASKQWALASLASANAAAKNSADYAAQYQKHQEEIASKQAQDAETARQQAFQENIQQQEADAESMRARAAMIEALTPP